MEGGDSLCTGTYSEENRGGLQQTGSTTYYTQGSNPPGDLRSELHKKPYFGNKWSKLLPFSFLLDWDASTIFRPLPVKTSLSLIVELFSSALLDPLGIDAFSIMEWFASRSVKVFHSVTGS